MSIIRNPSVNVYGLQRDLQREMNRLLDNFFPTTPKRAALATLFSYLLVVCICVFIYLLLVAVLR